MRSFPAYATALCLFICAGGYPLPAATQTRAAPDSVFGIVLRRPLNPRVLTGKLCFTGRQLALEDGAFDIVTDDILVSAPEEHQDTAAVLASLDQFMVCRGRTRDRGATAIITLLDSVVGHALFYWPEATAPGYDQMLRSVTRVYGEPLQNASAVRYWAADSMSIVVNERSPYGEGPSLDLEDARVCARYEELVHRNNTRDRRSYPCWEKPERLDPGEVFTEPAVSLADSDMSIGGVAYGADSIQVRRMLGAPAATDSLSWTYPGLRIWFKTGRVNSMVLTTPERATVRGLRVGDPVARAKPLYGSPCIREIWAYCRDVKNQDEGQGMMLEVKDHRITEIRVGSIFSVQRQ